MNARRPASDSGPHAALERALRGRISFEPADREACSIDFGNHEKATPRAVVFAEDEADVAVVLDHARRVGAKVSVRGAGHSSGGQTLADDGIVIVNRCASPPRMLEDGGVELASGLTWEAADEAMRRWGVAMPVMTDHMATSVGGTLSTGGFGPRSFRHGAQVDHVARARVVLPSGEARWCGPGDPLFRWTLAGCGAAAFLSRVVVRVRPRSPWAAIQMNKWRRLEQVVDLLERFDGTCDDDLDYFFAQRHRGKLWSTCGVAATTRDEAERLTLPSALTDSTFNAVRLAVREDAFFTPRPRSTGLPSSPPPRQMWSDYVFPLPALREFVRRMDRGPRGAFAAEHAMTRLLSIKAAPVRFPFDVRGGRRVRSHGVGFYFRLGEPAAAAQAAEFHRDCIEACVELGGRPYLYGWTSMSPRERQALFGDAVEDLVAFRATHDPGGIFNARALP